MPLNGDNFISRNNDFNDEFNNKSDCEKLIRRDSI